MLCAPAMQIYQILNHYTPRAELDPGFKILDNSANERPDWYEYWPIRNFLVNEPLDENAYYGFLSPKFKIKTNLTAEQTYAFIASSPADTDVVLLSPSIHKSAYYLNVFEHGDVEHPGLKGTAERFFARIGQSAGLADLVTDSRNTVHSNYFIAKPRFWRAWLEVTEQIYSLAESAEDPVGAELRAPTHYRGQRSVQMKIFLMERVATWILATHPEFRARVRDPFVARTRIYKLPLAIICDSLKIAYTTECRGQYKDVFMLVSAISGLWTWQLKVAGFLRIRAVRRHLTQLKSYWDWISA
jgi:hypothetical protein